MTTHNAPDAVAEAASEIARLYKVLDRAAVDLTPEYAKQRLAGKEGTTWAKFGLGRRRTPILDAVMRHNGIILLGAGYDVWNVLLDEYRLNKIAMLFPSNDGTFIKTHAITVRWSPRGFSAGAEYAVIGGRVLQAGYDRHGPAPTVGADGKLAWSTPRSSVNNTFSDLVAVDSELQKVVERLRAYESDAGPVL